LFFERGGTEISDMFATECLLPERGFVGGVGHGFGW
jgi:hypothetical protein